jgi:hypothetical protein
LANGFVISAGGSLPFPLCRRIEAPAGPGTTVILSFPSLSKRNIITYFRHYLLIVDHPLYESPSMFSLKAIVPTVARKAKGDDLSESDIGSKKSVSNFLHRLGICKFLFQKFGAHGIYTDL